MSFSCIVLANGNGNRFGERKQFFPFKGIPMWEYVANICLTLTKDVLVMGINCEGGKTRQESVYFGLKKILHNRVVILDACRPGILPQHIYRIASELSPSSTYFQN